MVEVGGIRFGTSLGVLFELKETKQHKTLQESYAMLEKSDIENMLDVLTASYNRENKTKLSSEQFGELLEKRDVGFLLMGDMFSAVATAILYSGLSPQEVESKKKSLNQFIQNKK